MRDGVKVVTYFDNHQILVMELKLLDILTTPQTSVKEL